MIDHKALKDALRVITETESLVNNETLRYKQTLKDLESQKDYVSPNYYRESQQKAKSGYDAVVNKLMKHMRTALDIVKENNHPEAETVNFDDTKFQNALRFIDSMGKSVSPIDQVNLINQFRGRPAELKALASKFKEKGLYFNQEAEDLAKPIPGIAIENAERVLAGYEYNGEINFGHMYWNKSQFRKQAERNGYDLDTAADPYMSALEDELKRLQVQEATDDPTEKAKRNFAEYHLKTAIQKMSGNAALEDGETNESIFASTIQSIENNNPGVEA